MTVLVVCGILVDQDGYVFIAQRSDSKFWEFPGGKKEQGEGEVAALQRELKEELDVDLPGPFQYFSETVWFNGRKDIHLRAYMTQVGVRPDVTLVDHLQFQWIKPQELIHWSMTPADQSLVQDVMKWATKS